MRRGLGWLTETCGGSGSWTVLEESAHAFLNKRASRNSIFMRLNWEHQILGDRVILVPYCEHHVAKYHQWMQDPELQRLTASEPLTLQEEYLMQTTWLNSEDKCTFIILSKDIGADVASVDGQVVSMIGDTNLYLSEEGRVAEAEIMIAEADFRGRRLGWEAMCLMLRYGVEQLNVGRFIAKIKMSNEASIAMFHKLRFRHLSESSYFQEVTMQVDVDQLWRDFLISQTASFTVGKFVHTALRPPSPGLPVHVARTF